MQDFGYTDVTSFLANIVLQKLKKTGTYLPNVLVIEMWNVKIVS